MSETIPLGWIERIHAKDIATVYGISATPYDNEGFGSDIPSARIHRNP